MKNEGRFMVGGFMFGNDEDVKQAKEEEGTIKFLEQKINYDDTNTTLRIYDKAIKERIFKTPIGFEFLRKMQTELIRRGVPEESIKAVPLYQVFSKEQKEKPVRVVKKKEKPDKTRVYLRYSVWINIFLIIVVVGMFVISLMGETPNIVNYRFRIQDEYAAWEQELMEREAEIKERERELSLE